MKQRSKNFQKLVEVMESDKPPAKLKVIFFASGSPIPPHDPSDLIVEYFPGKVATDDILSPEDIAHIEMLERQAGQRRD